MRNEYAILVGKLEVDNSEDLDVNGTIILEWILGKQDGKLIGFIWTRIETSGGLL
jgi:hypothetical protein